MQVGAGAVTGSGAGTGASTGAGAGAGAVTDLLLLDSRLHLSLKKPSSRVEHRVVCGSLGPSLASRAVLAQVAHGAVTVPAPEPVHGGDVLQLPLGPLLPGVLAGHLHLVLGCLLDLH